MISKYVKTDNKKADRDNNKTNIIDGDYRDDE
jgi:hypothetical protein